MLRKDIEYVDYNGIKRKKTAWFHLTEFEATEIALDLPEDVLRDITDISEENDTNNVVFNVAEKLGTKGIKDFVKSLVRKSYGVRSSDGSKFIKNDEVFAEFEQSPAYSNFMMELMRNSKASSDFINGVIPPELAANVSVNIGSAADVEN